MKLKIIGSLLIGLIIAREGRGQDTLGTSQTFTTYNAKTDPMHAFGRMLRLDYRNLLRLNTDLSGGLIGTVMAGGKITLNVYAYDDSKADGRGINIYSVYIDQTSTTYSGKTTIVPVSLKSDSASPAWNISTNSDDIRTIGQMVPVSIPQSDNACVLYQNSLSVRSGPYTALMNGLSGPVKELDRPVPSACTKYYFGGQPIIVEAIVNNATLNNVKIPEMGEFQAGVLFSRHRPLADIGGTVTLGSHRGDWQDNLAPENTQQSIDDMYSHDYKMVELDMGITADSIIVFHDMGLNKRTILTGAVDAKPWSALQNLYIKNRFDELIQNPTTKMMLFGAMLDYIKQKDPGGNVFLNLDRSANDINDFKRIYRIVDSKGMLDRTIFKGRFNAGPDINGEISPTVASIRRAFTEMYPNLPPAERDDKMKLMHFTPVLFDNNKSLNTPNDTTYARRVKNYVDSMISSGIADGFELNYKSYPVGAPGYANSTNDNVFLLAEWAQLGDAVTPTRNFVEYVHSRGLPVGIFASVPEVCAIPDFNSDGSRNINRLVSGFVKEDVPGMTYVPFVKDQPDYDFRGDWDFYVPAGADYIITDRPDALRLYLIAIGRY